MNFLEKSEKNIERLVEVATTGGEGGVDATKAVHSFTGRSGKKLGGIFAGPNHPDYGNLKDLLQKQLNDRFEKEDYSVSVSLPYETKWDIVFKDYKFDDSTYLTGLENKKFKSISDKYQEVNIDIEYDNNLDDFIDKDIFINDTNDFKEVKYSDVVNKWGANK